MACANGYRAGYSVASSTSGAGNLTPVNLMTTAGPLIGMQIHFGLYDGRYAAAELPTYSKWVAGGKKAVDGS